MPQPERSQLEAGAKRRDVAKAILHFGRSPYTGEHVIGRCPDIKPGTIRACISALRKTGNIEDAPAPKRETGHWYRTGGHVFEAVDPVEFLIKAVESHSATNRAAVGKHIDAVVPAALRSVPKYRLVGFLDARERAPHIRQVARFLREQVATASEIVNLLAEDGLVTWDGNRVRRTRTWNTAAALGTLSRSKEKPVLEPRKGKFVRRAGEALPDHQEMAVEPERPARKPEAVEDDVIQRLKGLLAEYSLFDILVDYESVRAENRRLREENQKFEMLQAALTSAGLLAKP